MSTSRRQDIVHLSISEPQDIALMVHHRTNQCKDSIYQYMDVLANGASLNDR